VDLVRSYSNRHDVLNDLGRAILAVGAAPDTEHPATAAEPRYSRQLQRRLTATEVVELVREYESGADMTELAARWGVHRTTVASHLRRAGAELRRQGLSAEQVAVAIRLYEGGQSCERLADRFRCDDETVRLALRQAGVTMRSPWTRR
jgi:DNA-directed RNA polymerase specialized sigma24 family protein